MPRDREVILMSGMINLILDTFGILSKPLSIPGLLLVNLCIDGYESRLCFT
jgi:hypothetical protein